MEINVRFYSFLKDVTGGDHLKETMPEGSTLGDLFKKLSSRFPKLQMMEKSILMAVGVDYQKSSYVLQDSDEVSFFPPVQGG
jgi:molybdopterin converting factor small subunit